MSSVCGGLDYKDAESHHLTSTSALSSNKCSNNGSNLISGTGSEDAQESDGDDSSGYIHPYVNVESKDVIKPILKSSDDEDEGEGEDKNLATAESSSAALTVIPAIKGSREKKHGKSLEKLSVSWAEDVYDPPPSLVSHTRSKIQKPHKSKSKDSLKKNGKKGQKGNSSNSSSSSSRGSKDKKSSSSRSKHSRDNKFGWATQTSIVAASS